MTDDQIWQEINASANDNTKSLIETIEQFLKVHGDSGGDGLTTREIAKHFGISNDKCGELLRDMFEAGLIVGKRGKRISRSGYASTVPVYVLKYSRSEQ